MSDSGKSGSILVIDDNPVNLDFLSSALEKEGYSVNAAISARLALASLDLFLPDIILLDVKMPEMDGYELCRLLKADARHRMIPVIFVSALGEVVDKVKAFQVGAVDYITKPFQLEEVLARVGTHIAMREMQKSLEEKNQALQQEILHRQQAEKELLALGRALEQKVAERTASLEETNTALKVLLKRREEDRRNLEEDILSNVRELIVPYFDKLKNTQLRSHQRVLIDILENGMNEILSPFVKNLFDCFPSLTPTEFQIASLIHEGKTAKQIADLFNVSLNTVKFHKANLRLKFGLKNKPINLQTFLKTMNKSS